MSTFQNPSFGADFGTANTLIYFKDQGLYPRLPGVEQLPAKVHERKPRAEMYPPLRSYAILRKRDNKIIQVGDAAYNMLGREPEGFEVIRWGEAGRIMNTDVMIALFDKLLNDAYPQVSGASRFIEPKLVVLPISDNTEPVHGQLMVEAIRRRFWKVPDKELWKANPENYNGRIEVVSQAAVSILGVASEMTPTDLNPEGAVLVVDVGGGTTNVAIVVDGINVVFHRSIPIGGDLMNKEIQAKVLEVHKLEIGLLDAESVKFKLGRAIAPKKKPFATGPVSGKCAVNGQVKKVTLTEVEVYEWMEPILLQIIDGVKVALRDFGKPQVLSDLGDKPSKLTGGGGQVQDFDLLVQRGTGLEIHRALDPLYSVILGTKRVVDEPRLLDGFVLDLKKPRIQEDAWTSSLTETTIPQSTANRSTTTSGTSMHPL